MALPRIIIHPVMGVWCLILIATIVATLVVGLLGSTRAAQIISLSGCLLAMAFVLGIAVWRQLGVRRRAVRARRIDPYSE